MIDKTSDEWKIAANELGHAVSLAIDKFKKVTGSAKKMNKELEKKVGQAVKLLQVCYKAAGEPLEVAYSGGKDSDVILELAMTVRDMGKQTIDLWTRNK